MNGTSLLRVGYVDAEKCLQGCFIDKSRQFEFLEEGQIGGFRLKDG